LNGKSTLLARKGYVPAKPYQYANVEVKPLLTIKQKGLEAFFHTALGIFWIALHRERFDLIHFHGIGPSLFTPLARLLGFKVVVTNHGADYDRQKWGKFAKNILKIGEFLGCRFAHRVIAVSENIKTTLKRKYHSDAEYIPNGVFVNSPIPARDVLTSFNIKAKKYILCVGRLVPEKGFHDLVKAYLHSNTEWKLVIVGDADHEDDYSRSLKDTALNSDSIVMTGFQKGRVLQELYSNAGLFVLPSYHEGLPIVALEAMSYGLPMFVSNIAANRETAQPEEIFPVGDVKALAEKIAQFTNNQERYFHHSIFETKQQRLSFEYNWDVIANKTAHVYESLMD
jgi:glycosyltransferase involved in cell wall biosynthesis